MLLMKIIHRIAGSLIGKELGLALAVLNAIRQALGNPQISDLAGMVYTQLPAGWRKPQGPLTESEFVDLVLAGQTFLTKIQAVIQA
jgi:hypothetical protein